MTTPRIPFLFLSGVALALLGSAVSASAFEQGFDRRFSIRHARAEGLYFTLSAQPLEYTGDFLSSLTLWHFEKSFFIPRLGKSGVLDIGVGLGSKTAYGSWEIRYSLALPKAGVDGRNESVQFHNLEINGRSFIWPRETVHAYLQLGIAIPVVFVKDGAFYRGADLNAIYAGAGANLGGGVLFDLGRETFINIGAVYRFQVFLYAYGEGKGRDINHLRTVYGGDVFGRLLRSSSFGLTVSLGFML
jgi:hypothetical protein